MTQRTRRTFSEVDPMTIARPYPFAVGIYGHTGTGKSKSAIRLARGIVRVYGGEIRLADADGGRDVHFRDEYPGELRYIDFPPPHNALDFADLISGYMGKGGVLIIDQLTQEHEGEDGLLDTHAAEKERKGGEDSKNAAAWAIAKAQHKVLARVVRQAVASGLVLILCWRAQDKTDWNNKEGGKVKPIGLGEMPIGSMDLPFEMTATYLLPAGSRGSPCLDPKERGELLMTKIPDEFRGIVRRDQQFCEEHGEAMARWAMSGATPGAKLATAAPPAEKLDPKRAAMVAKLDAVKTIEDLDALLDDLSKGFPRKDPKNAAVGAAYDRAAKRAEDHASGIAPPEHEPPAGGA